MRRCAIGLAAMLLVAPNAYAAKRQAPRDLLQPQASDRGLVLSVDGRRAKVVEQAKTRRGFKLRRGERVLRFAELEAGWVAAGVRLHRDDLDLSLVADLGRGPRRLTPPAERTGAIRTAPRPVVDGTSLRGLLWLEGELDNLAVRAAVLENGSFVGTETVSPAPARGSQTGLTTTVLADGTWLAAWSRFDGTDDEIYWSRRPAGGRWSTPRRLTSNQTPDVTPQLLARGSGALLAWSQQKDEYEVVTARFDGAAWTAPTSLGVAGTVTPRFRSLPEADYLLVRNAWPGGWTAFRLDADGRPADFASVVEESNRAPVLLDRPGRGLAFEWGHRPRPEDLSWEPVR